MGLFDLPAELRVRIYDFLGLTGPGSNLITPKKRLTPAVCCASRQLREETLPIYAQTTHFIIQADDDLSVRQNRVVAWADALGSYGIEHVKVLQLSGHWQIDRPSRGQGHVGFYVRIERGSDGWQCLTGTYPIARDEHGMRRESIDLLQSVVREQLAICAGLARLDVKFLLAAMRVVASHPIDVELAEQAKMSETFIRPRFHPGTWRDLEQELLALKQQWRLEAEVFAARSMSEGEGFEVTD